MTEGQRALAHLRERGITATVAERDGVQFVKLTPMSRVTPDDRRFVAAWKEAILGELRGLQATPSRYTDDQDQDASVVSRSRRDRGTVSSLGGSQVAGRDNEVVAVRSAVVDGACYQPSPSDQARLGAWEYLRACVYEMAEAWDALPETARTTDDFEKITRALDEWTATYAVGQFWGFNRQAFDAQGAAFRKVCRDVMGDVLHRKPAPGAEPPERMDALTLLEEHAYFDPIPKALPAVPFGPSSGIGPTTCSTAPVAATGTRR